MTTLTGRNSERSNRGKAIKWSVYVNYFFHEAQI